MAKKRNPQDTTLRNTRATNKRLDRIEALLKQIAAHLADVATIAVEHTHGNPV